MSDREKQLVGLVLALLVLLASYYLIYKPIINEKIELEDELVLLNEEVEVLRAEYDKLPEYKEGIKEAQNSVKVVEKRYPAGLVQESAFKLLFDIENDFEDIEFTEAAFSMVESLAYSNELDAANSVQAIKQTITSSVELPYESIKELLTFIYDYEDRTVLDGFTLSMNKESGLIGMNLNMNMYALKSNEREFTPPTFEGVPMGNATLFSPDASAASDDLDSSGNKVLKDDRGDLFITLKPVKADIEAQVVGLTADNIQKSYVKTDINGAVEAILRLYVRDGQYYANYDVDGIYKTEQAFVLGDALEVDLYSADRLDEFDLVEMNLTIINESPSTLYINRKEEDTEQPRLNVVVQEGLVEFR